MNNSIDLSIIPALKLNAFDAFDILRSVTSLRPNVTGSTIAIGELKGSAKFYRIECWEELEDKLYELRAQILAVNGRLMRAEVKFRISLEG